MIGDIIVAVISVILSIIWKLAIIWAPLLLGWLAFFLWHHFVVERFISGIEFSLLEIHIPREMKRPLQAMELFYTNGLYHMSQKGGWESYWQGAVHFWYSLEMVGIGGRVRFFIRVPSRLKKLVTTQIYAQYPQVRVEEVEDYTLKMPRYRADGNWYLWGCEFKLIQHDAYPIKTYKQWGLEEAGLKEEEKVDPMTPIIEYLGSLDPGVQVWIQIIIRQSAKRWHEHGTVAHHLDFIQEAERVLNQALDPYTKKGLNVDGSTYKEIRMPDTIKQRIKFIKEKMSKLHFDVGIRQIVLADKRLVSQNEFNGWRRSSRLLWRQYTDPDANGFSRFNSTQYDQPFADPTGKLLEKRKNRFLTYFKLRTMYYPPILMSFKYPLVLSIFFPSNVPEYFVLSTEELATIFHFPGLVSEAPAFKRIETKVAKPPSNLPF